MTQFAAIGGLTNDGRIHATIMPWLRTEKSSDGGNKILATLGVCDYC